jgi:hypothetical protein
MALRFITNTPNKLLSTFKKAIDDGHVDTWSYDKDGDFTHTPPQWNKLAWLRPSVVDGEKLIFKIIRPQNSTVSTEVYAVYHGRFIESMLAHCNQLFTDARATATADSGDLI